MQKKTSYDIKSYQKLKDKMAELKHIINSVTQFSKKISETVMNFGSKIK